MLGSVRSDFDSGSLLGSTVSVRIGSTILNDSRLSAGRCSIDGVTSVPRLNHQNVANSAATTPTLLMTRHTSVPSRPAVWFDTAGMLAFNLVPCRKLSWHGSGD